MMDDCGLKQKHRKSRWKKKDYRQYQDGERKTAQQEKGKQSNEASDVSIYLQLMITLHR